MDQVNTMFDQMFDNFRRMSESALQMQQDMFRQWTQQWPMSMPMGAASPDWAQTFQKRWQDLATDSLKRHREVLDATYKSGIQAIEQTFRASEATSPEEQRRIVEDLWRKLFDTMKEHSESQFREFQKSAELWVEMMQKAHV
jgi:predicted solute-binding protein